MQEQIARAQLWPRVSVGAKVAEWLRAVRAKGGTPAPKPEPVIVDLGDGHTVTIRWKKTSGLHGRTTRAAKQLEATRRK